MRVPVMILLSDDTVIYFVYEETVTQEKLDLIIKTWQKWFLDAKLKLNISKAEYMKVVQKNAFNADLKLIMDYKFSNVVKLLGFILGGNANQFSYFFQLLYATENLFYQRHI